MHKIIDNINVLHQILYSKNSSLDDAKKSV